MADFDPKDPQNIAAFNRLCELEPRLRQLYDDAKAKKEAAAGKSFNPTDAWYGTDGLRSRLVTLVGFGAGYPEPVADTLGIGEMLVDGKKDRPRFVDAADLGREAEERISGFPEELTTSDAYDLAYDVIYNQLEDD